MFTILLKQALLSLIDNLDSGNTNISEEEALELLDHIRFTMDDKSKLSKYQACNYLEISRATFDNYVKIGKIPKGRAQQGFKEIFWYKSDLKIIKESKCKLNEDLKERS